MDNFIKEHLNKIEAENLSDEARHSLIIVEAELSVLMAELENTNEKLEKNRYVTIPQAAKIMNISRKRLDEIIRNSEIPVIRYTSKTLLIDLVDIRKYIESKKVFYTNNKEAEKEEK